MLHALSEHFLNLEQFFRSLGFFGVLAFAGVLVGLGVLCLPLSPFGIMAGLFFGLGEGFLAVQLGTAAGATANFLLSRYFVRERVTRWLKHHEKFKLIDAAIGREGWKIVGLLRFCPIPFGLANYSFGITAVGFVPYVVATVVAIIPANFFFVWFGATSRDALAVLSGTARATPGQAAFTIVGLIAFFAVLTYITRIARAAIARGQTGAAP